MLELRPFERLGRTNFDWLDARFHFSFANYHEPGRESWGALRVWNDDTVKPGTGFDPHPHRDMEIITYVRKGTVSHMDHLGNRGRIEAGDVQVMSAGRGIVHAEYADEQQETQVFQIWILPDRRGHEPRWGTKSFPKGDRAGRLVALASGREAEVAAGALRINQDAALVGATLMAGQSVVWETAPARHAYLVPATGVLEVNGVRVNTRDGLAVTGESRLEIRAIEESEIVLVDAP
ncbi:MAG TPA: pirin family protein [Azospirillaceae bacterium]|nr:pirin family protein [Azospirillaceae bacterium]